MIKESSLKNIYFNNNIKYTNFHGYECPLFFSGIINEVKLVRNYFGVFDLFHMGKIWIYKDNSFYNLENVLSTKLSSIKPYDGKGKAKYSLIINQRGTIEDDIVIYDFIDKIFIVCNAVNKEKVKNIFKSVDLSVVESDWCMVALQGPYSSEVIQKYFNSDFSNIFFYEYIFKDDFLISRSGYTGEDGFEIYSSDANIREFLNWVIRNHEEVMCGLGARDTLRIEVGLPLYGNEIDDNTNPLEANLMWAVNKEIHFDKGKVLKYFTVEDTKRIPRKGDKVYHDNKEVGYVTSGTFSPTIDKPLGMLYLYELADNYQVKDIPLVVKDKPIVNTRYYKKK